MNSPYFVIPLGVLLILFYLISLMFQKFKLLKQNQHRKIWNVILLITFITTVILGLLLAIQINYKLEWEVVKSFTKWHVNFGIAMSFVAIFHLTWHWRYYIDILKRNKPYVLIKPRIPNEHLPFNYFKILILTSGLIATVVQVLLIREITTIFEGNELMVAWTIGIWMLLTGTGALISKDKSLGSNFSDFLSVILLALTIIPLILVILLNILKTEIFPPGVLVSPFYFLIIILVILLPICLLLGFLFSIFVRSMREYTKGFIKVYSLESFGSLIGGLLVTIVFIKWFSILESFIMLIIITGSIMFIFTKSKIYSISIIIAILILISFKIWPVDNYFKKNLFPNQKIVTNTESYYGNIIVTESFGQFNFFNNGSLLFTTDNTIGNEEFVHYPLLQHNNPKKVLLISGGVSGIIDEILKYSSVDIVDYIELNPELIKVGQRYRPISTDSKISVHIEDGKRYLKNCKEKYDIAILAIPDPSSLQVNRFYTIEFLAMLKARLSKNAVIAYGISSSGNYISDEKARINAIVYHTLMNVFKNVEIIPGEKDYFLASDSVLSNNISSLSLLRGIDNKYVNQFYIDDFVTQQRSNFIKENISKGKILNSDTKPFPVFYQSLRYISLFSAKNLLWLLAPLVLLLVPIFFFKNVSKSIYIAGFTASSVELIILFQFQVIFGYLYSALGIIIALFMGGLAIGSLIAGKIKVSKSSFLCAQILLGFFTLLFPLVFYLQSILVNSSLLYLVFIIITIMPSGMVGFIYATGTLLKQNGTQKEASVNYSADLIGSALGVVAITLLMIPALGINNSCYIIAGLNLVSVLLTFGKLHNIFKF